MPKIKITPYRICLKGNGPDVRLAVIADFHNGRSAPILQAVREIAPDIVLIAGDLYESPPRNPFAYDEAIALLRGLGALPGVEIIYTRGNHDHSCCEELDAALRDAHVIELDSSVCTLRGLLFGGLRSAHYAGGVPDLAFLDAFAAMPGAKILLSHHPEYYAPYIRSRSIDLTVSGHAHGGQWRLLGRPIFAPGQGVFPKYTHGMYEERLLVSRGASNSIAPVPRFGVPTEVLSLTVRREGSEHAEAR